MAAFDDFWGRTKQAVPGMLPGAVELGMGMWGQRGFEKETDQRLRMAQGPVYDQSMNLASGMLSRSTDPRAQAQQRLNMEMGLLKEGDAASEADFLRGQHARGMLDMATYDTAGKPMDPKMYAFLKARENRNAQMASNALDKGENAVNQNIARAGALQGTAGNTQRTGMIAQGARPSQALGNLEMLKKGYGIAKSSGMLDIGMDWLKKQFGGADIGSLGDYGAFDW
jgi:hypothetical protein